MKDKILDKAKEMFLSYGFKSVTMDDIAKELSVSKKTIYTHYSHKNDLVKEVVYLFFDEICEGIITIHEKELNPIKELFELKFYVMRVLKQEQASPQYQLQKYYPEIYYSLEDKNFEFTEKMVKETLQRGLDMGIFRAEIDIEFVFRIYFHGVDTIKNQDYFPAKQFNPSILMDNYLEYHLRGICNKKGIEILENQLKSKMNE